MSERSADAWCAADDCPAAICNGPHIEHVCGDDLVTARFDNPNPCPGCGKPLNAGPDIAARIPDDMMPDTPWPDERSGTMSELIARGVKKMRLPKWNEHAYVVPNEVGPWAKLYDVHQVFEGAKPISVLIVECDKHTDWEAI